MLAGEHLISSDERRQSICLRALNYNPRSESCFLIEAEACGPKLQRSRGTSGNII